MSKLTRRDILKTFLVGAVPIFGGVSWGVIGKRIKKEKEIVVLKEKSAAVKKLIHFNNIDFSINSKVAKGKKIRIGVIGAGGRAAYIMRAMGFTDPLEIDKWIEENKKNPQNKRYEFFKQQQDLNIEIVSVCDIYDRHAERAIRAGANINRNGSNAKMGTPPKRYKTYKELLNAGGIDAIIVATPDHWHATISIDAAKKGLHVYSEKPMTWRIPETFELRKVVKENNIVFQLGHQNRQTESYNRARYAIEKGFIGDVNLIQICTNRNTPNGAWVYHIDKEASPKNIDWKQFIGPAPWHDFSPERFFRWRCWWDYSTGLSGDLLTHEYDAMNQILGFGIPTSASSTGGIYVFKDGRTVPDVLTSSFEYADRGLTLLYSATQGNSNYRVRQIMGKDATMKVDNRLRIFADGNSQRYADLLKKGTINTNDPMYTFDPSRSQQSDVDAITSPTEKYFAQRGLLYTVVGGKILDTTHLHVLNWLNAIRTGSTPDCNIDVGFEEAITAHMGTVSYLSNRTVFWDNANEKMHFSNGDVIRDIAKFI